MRLDNPGLGEICDRLTILSLKCLFGEASGKSITHFQTEHTALLSKIRSRTLNAKWFESYTHLAAVNAALWHAEDDLRAWRARGSALANLGDDQMHDVVILAFRVQELNDKRAGYIAQINADAGEENGEEKI